MTDARPIEPALELLLAELQQSGAHLQDPIGWHYLQLLRAKANRSEQPLRAALQQRLWLATEQFAGRRQAASPLIGNAPATAAAQTQGGLLKDLVGYVQTRSQTDRSDGATGNTLPSSAARSQDEPVAYFRNTWTRLRSGKKLAAALEQAPRNAGPINSHNLVLRSLALMQEVSPAYLSHFVTYVDALLTLDAAGIALRTASAAPAAKTAKRVNATPGAAAKKTTVRSARRS